MSRFKYIVPLLTIFYSGFATAWDVFLVDNQNFLNNSADFYEYKAQKKNQFPVYLKAIYIDQDKLKAKIVQQSSGSEKSLIELVDDNKAVIGINGGYYRENFLPNGLLVIQGKQYSRMVNNDLLQGLVKVDLNDQLTLSSRKDALDIYSAFQAGPILYQNGKWYDPNWHKIRKRSVIIEFANHNILLVSVSAVSLSELVNILKVMFKHFPEKYGEISFALNLDGGRSSAFFVLLPSPVLVQEQDYIKTAILFSYKD